MKQIEDVITIEEKNHIDELTGLHNLTGILEHLQGHDQYSASDSTVIIYINVMNFKVFNQKYGFAGGNDFLRGMAHELKNLFPDELVARTSGDQFIVLGKSIVKEELLEKLEEFREAVHNYEKGLKMKIKAGIYCAKGDEEDPVIMVDRAKMACDDIIRVYDRDNNLYTEELDKRNELRQYVIDNFENAFKQRYFQVYYQKEIRAVTRKVCGYEALARWLDPQYGIISPAVFIEVLESVHLIHRLDIYMIDQVCSDLRDDIDSGYEVEPISVNLSRLDFELCDIMSEIDKCRAKYDIPKELLHIEVTESAIAAGADFLGKHIKKFRDAGYEVWMDDFGAGYSSFNNLKDYDFDVVKIDMGFLREFETNQKSRIILASIVNMAKELGIHTLAEGVETEEQYEFLLKIGCEKMQGYLFGKPKPVSEFVRSADCSSENCEEFDFSSYYDDIGTVNFLNSTPLRTKTMEIMIKLPIAIAELCDDKVTFIYANEAYIEFMKNIGAEDLEQANKLSVSKEMDNSRGLANILKLAETSYNHRSEADLVANGNVVNTKVRFLSRHGDKAAFALVSKNITAEKTAHTADDYSAVVMHLMNLYNRIDIFEEEGTVENIFISGNQKMLSDVERRSTTAVQLYSNMHIREEDRERFRKFFDINTVHERIDNTGRHYLTDYYKSALPGEEDRILMYIILPFYYNGKWKFIAGCRYIDQLDTLADVLEQMDK
ncbi:diguanylate cyclase (GGDEF) domain-containing protein [Butyrivibrio hungatei]|uniref:Diguanylate cyclase (GGDEF) domain-containing protein n=1 Tax=Butyrivibrio hungatei TaxID=185008 RepID=A0A1G5G875_9FIRM|nr:GGDEF domain-containing phosphodiesterase [Butyrivibrio hungatei]MBQ4217995.1 EAL domain-containing protein [Butyrivibrio sp.]MEE3471198.1 GGDEF domain-containing phosphodiesterase [Butyrivibrio hungatei]SCY47557.1 diguanylate cyclase (GGDEF) domain-containing protein [Butyrivibrio hungatei]